MYHLARQRSAGRAAEALHVDSLMRRQGSNILLIYIGSARCPWCADPRVPGALKSLHERVRTQAESAGMGFRSVGIAVDLRPEEGLRHLRKVGPMFRELASGGEWQGLAVAPLIWGDSLGRPGTPQVLVVHRRVIQIPSDIAATRTEISDQHVVFRAVGLDQILDWAAAGLHVPAARGASPAVVPANSGAI